mgnify:CR=1 FL=1
MKKLLSIYNLFFRSSALAAGITILASVCVQAAFLYEKMQGETMYFENIASGYTMLPSLLALILILWFMRDMLGSAKSRVGLTVQRLKVKPIPIFITEAVYIMMVLTVFWALTAGVTYAMAAYFTDNISTAESADTASGCVLPVWAAAYSFSAAGRIKTFMQSCGNSCLRLFDGGGELF